MADWYSEMTDRVAQTIVDGLRLKTKIGKSERRLARSVIDTVLEEHRREYKRWAAKAVCWPTGMD